jgi:hypothetical protein
MALSREEYLKRTASLAYPVTLSDGATMFVRALSAGDSERLEELDFPVGPDGKCAFARRGSGLRLVCFAACDQEGRRLLTEADLPALEAVPADDITRLVAEALKVNPWLRSGGAAKDQAKNS